MKTIGETFSDAKKNGEKLLIGYLTFGDPSLRASMDYCLALEKGGVDILEIGLPHSDPVADGPVLVRAADRALKSGTLLPDIFKSLNELREKGLKLPVLFFTYWNPVLRYGVRKFSEEARKCGAQGALIVDLPPEEAGEYLEEMKRAGLETVFLVSPTTHSSRLGSIIDASTGFVYVVARAGVTGERTEIDPKLKERIQSLRSAVKGKPLAVGFGVSSGEQASSLSQVSDAVVVGSAFVRIIEDAKSHEEAVASLKTKSMIFKTAMNDRAKGAIPC